MRLRFTNDPEIFLHDRLLSRASGRLFEVTEINPITIREIPINSNAANRLVFYTPVTEINNPQQI